jgi:alanine racemase
LRSAPRIRLAGIYTHFASADDVDDPFTFEQIARFESLVDTLREAGITAPMHHLANSAAVMRGLIRPGDYVRTGVAMFGAATVGADGRLEPVMRWRTEIARLKELPAGEGVGYGRTFVCTRPSIIATVPVGYADGYNRRLSNCGEVLVRGKRAPVVGRISMDLVTIDVTDVDGVVVGDEVVLLGRQGDDEITAEELGGKLGTISYEVFCAVGARVPRVFRDGDTVVSIRTRFDR